MSEQQQQRAPVWLVEHPTHRYAEDVKALARKAGLRVLDPAGASEAETAGAVEGPKLTLKPEFAPAKPAVKYKE